MPVRQLPVRPNPDHVNHEAKTLLRAYRAGDASAAEDFREFGDSGPDSSTATLSDAQLVLARSYGASSFAQILAAIEFILACWSTHAERVRDAVVAHAELLKNFYATRRDGLFDDVKAAAQQGTLTANSLRRKTVALVDDETQSKVQALEWDQIVSTLEIIGDRPKRGARPTELPAEFLSLIPKEGDIPTPDLARKLMEIMAEKIRLRTTPEQQAISDRVREHMNKRAQDPATVVRQFERMRAFGVEFPDLSHFPLELRRPIDSMREQYHLYLQSHPLT